MGILFVNGLFPPSLQAQRATNIRGIRCVDGTVTLDANGDLQSCTLERDYRHGNIECLGNHEINFYGSRRLQSCTLDVDIRWGSVECLREEEIGFYSSGALRRCTLEKDLRIRGTECQRNQEVVFDEFGSIRYCTEV
ncbi:MAG: hypothetical protein ACOC3E_02400 [Cyanobacteriota bacterium]